MREKWRKSATTTTTTTTATAVDLRLSYENDEMPRARRSLVGAHGRVARRVGSPLEVGGRGASPSVTLNGHEVVDDGMESVGGDEAMQSVRGTLRM